MSWQSLTVIPFYPSKMLVLSFSCHLFSSPASVWHYKKIIFWQYQGKCGNLLCNLNKKPLSALKQHSHTFQMARSFFFSWYKVCLLTSSQLFSSICISMQAWLTEIHEYAQKDVVIMLLGNKVSGTSWGGARETALKVIFFIYWNVWNYSTYLARFPRKGFYFI